MLTDISWGIASQRVREFIIQAYVKGAKCGSADRSELEGSTSVFAKRRFRDRWNRTIVRGLANVRNHTLKIKARVRARGAKGQQWFNDRRTQFCKKTSRTQALWMLHLDCRRTKLAASAFKQMAPRRAYAFLQLAFDVSHFAHPSTSSVIRLATGTPASKRYAHHLGHI